MPITGLHADTAATLDLPVAAGIDDRAEVHALAIDSPRANGHQPVHGLGIPGSAALAAVLPKAERALSDLGCGAVILLGHGQSANQLAIVMAGSKLGLPVAFAEVGASDQTGGSGSELGGGDTPLLALIADLILCEDGRVAVFAKRGLSSRVETLTDGRLTAWLDAGAPRGARPDGGNRIGDP